MFFATPEHEPAQKIEELDQWTHALTAISRRPLALCPDFPRIAARHEAWWAQRLEGGPLLLAQVNPNPARPITRRLELLCDPQAWLEAKRRDMLQLHRVGDMLPGVRIDFGAVMLGGLMG